MTQEREQVIKMRFQELCEAFIGSVRLRVTPQLPHLHRQSTCHHLRDAVVQRCLVHKERNLKAKLSKRHWGEVSRLFTRLRGVQGYEAAKEVFDELDKFIKPINAEAHTSLYEAGEDLQALYRLNVPNTLHRCLLSTNAIENSFRTTRRKLDRVTRFRAETDQTSRWLSYALLEAEKGFRRITGCKSVPHLLAALARPESETS
ncbi:transposase, mutator type [Rhodopirellula sallentina SM41]|uniref:Mutator family transposase n=2 Tax=Rhodopirellula TaxID=265488 RepID=M5U7U8_9BACT|nr:transposase, mutator type [Rhodopirellula sallentina SM41]